MKHYSAGRVVTLEKIKFKVGRNIPSHIAKAQKNLDQLIAVGIIKVKDSGGNSAEVSVKTKAVPVAPSEKKPAAPAEEKSAPADEPVPSEEKAAPAAKPKRKYTKKKASANKGN